MSWKEVESVLIPIQLLLAMFGMGATLSLREFFNVVRHPTGVAIGLGQQWLMVPLLALATGWLFSLSPGWAVGLLLVAATPGGAFSNLMTFLARGHTPLSISVTLAATLACLLTAPLILRLTASGVLPAGFSLPAGRIILEVCSYLVAPLAAGMAVFRFLPGRAKLLSKLAIWTSMTLVATIAAGALVAGRIEVAAYGWRPPAIILAFAVVIHWCSTEVTHLFRRYDDETMALAIEVSVRNGGVGLLLLQFFFVDQPSAQGHALYTILFYTGVQIFVPIPGILLHRAGRSPLLLRAARRRPAAERREAGAEGAGGAGSAEEPGAEEAR
jgi:BASS family bile acid:Na+ symporter